MNVSQCMTKDIRICSPTDSIAAAAQSMRNGDFGFIPVGENDRLVGMLTDRDIAVRAVAAQRSPATSVRDVMTSEVHFCFEDQEIEAASQMMSDLKVRRLPVLSRDKRLVGVISIGDIARISDAENAGETLGAISQPGGAHVD